MPKFVGPRKTGPKIMPKKRISPKASVRRLAEIKKALINYYMLKHKITESETSTRFWRTINKKALALLEAEKGKIAPRSSKNRKKEKK